MRNYYRAGGHARKRCPSQSVRSNDLHWFMLAALVRGSALLLSWDVLCLAMSVLQTRTAEAYMTLSNTLDSRLTMYDETTAISLIRAERQLVAFLKKFPFSKSESSMDPRAVATEKLLSAEAQCRRTNERLRQTEWSKHPEWVYRARRLIASCLGPLTPSTIMTCLERGSHGPGATRSSRGGGRTTPFYKVYDTPYSCTSSALPYAYAAISANPKWLEILEDSGRRTAIPPVDAPRYQKELMLLESVVDIVEHDKVTFVPKDARQDRPIAIGASLNIFLQLGVKAVLEEKLKAVNVDLTTQSKNIRMAREGSRYAYCNGMSNPSQFSTIDLASASDTISLEIVRLLLPHDWFGFLYDLRHHSGELDGEILVYEKFSAMGNGYTFPLESLVFWAVAKAAAEIHTSKAVQAKDIAIFGDDLIVRRHVAGPVIDALNYAGFTVNTEKSFLEGNFKESCGADFYRGTNVRPFYLKRQISTLGDIYFVANSVARLCLDNRGHRGLTELYQACLDLIPASIRRYTPLNDNLESGFNVPFSVVARQAYRPWLYPEEGQTLVKAGFLKQGDLYHQAPVAWQTEAQAICYKGRAKVRLFVSLASKGRTLHKHATSEDLLHLSAAEGGLVTRRQSVKRVTRVVSVSNWDNTHSHHALSVLHPVNWART